MAKIYKLTKGGQTIIPATTTDAVVNPKTRKSLTTELSDLSYHSVLLYQIKLYQGSFTFAGKINNDEVSIAQNRLKSSVFVTKPVKLIVPDGFSINLVYADDDYNITGDIIRGATEITTQYPYARIGVIRQDGGNLTPDDVQIPVYDTYSQKMHDESMVHAEKIVQSSFFLKDTGTEAFIMARNMIRELYVSTVEEGLRLMLIRRFGDAGITDTRVIIGQTTDGVQKFVFNFNLGEAVPEGTEAYHLENDYGTCHILVDWSKYTAPVNTALNDDFIFNRNIYKVECSPVIFSKLEDTALKTDYDTLKSGYDGLEKEIGSSTPRDYTQDVTWQKGAIISNTGADNNSSSYLESRRRTQDYIPVYVSRLSFSAAAYSVLMVMFYGADKVYINTYPGIYTWEGTRTDLLIDSIKPDGAEYYRVCIKYPDISPEDITFMSEGYGLKKDIQTLRDAISGTAALDNLIIVDTKGGGDYETIEDALANAGDSADNHVVIIVMPGTYYPAPKKNGDRPYVESNRNLSLIGMNRDACILKGDVGYYDYRINVDYALLRLSGNVLVENFTLINTSEKYESTATGEGWDLTAPHNRAYCFHADYNRNPGDVTCIRNCKMYNDHFSCIGWGLRAESTLRLENCEFDADVSEEKNSQSGFSSFGAIYGHLAAGVTNAMNQRLEIIRCIVRNRNYPTAINQMDGSGADDYTNISSSLMLVGNICKTTDMAASFKNISIEGNPQVCALDETSYGNNVASMNSVE